MVFNCLVRLRSLDSNQEFVLQRHPCYRYTTPHQAAARNVCRGPGSNRHGGFPPSVFETDASAYSATPASANNLRATGSVRHASRRPQQEGYCMCWGMLVELTGAACAASVPEVG